MGRLLRALYLAQIRPTWAPRWRSPSLVRHPEGVVGLAPAVRPVPCPEHEQSGDGLGPDSPPFRYVYFGSLVDCSRRLVYEPPECISFCYCGRGKTGSNMKWLQKYGGIITGVLGTLFIIWALTLAGLATFVYPEYWAIAWMLAVYSFGAGVFSIWVGHWEKIMRLGIVERVLERRRMAAAAAMMDKYDGIDLSNSLEAAALPVPRYECANENCTARYARNPASDLYWVDAQPLLKGGWYCEECVDKLSDKPKVDRLNMETFLIMLEGDFSSR